MSQYISSFLIDPVVRQARRFSRPTHEPPNDEIRGRRSLRGNEASSNSDTVATGPAPVQEDLTHLRISIDGLPTNVTGTPQVISPASLEDPASLHIWQHSQRTDEHPHRLVETEDLEAEVNARRYPIAAAEDTSSNPLYGVQDGFRSTTSSISTSHQSMMDSHMSSADPSAQASRGDTQDTRARGDSGSNRVGDAALPEDDGMGHMRKRIIAVQRTDSSNEMKARLVHGIMTEKHNSSQQNLHAPHLARAQSPGSMHSSNRPFTPSSPKSMDSLRQTVSPTTSSNADASNPFQLSPEDLKPTYYQKTSHASKNGENESSTMEVEEVTKALGCEHYKRNIKLQCSACNRWYTCRFCHDAVEDHMLNRRETKHMLCMLCGCAQPAGEECALCSERGAWYYCDVCKLWDDDPEKSIYHCNDCGICRVGQGLGKDFFHCKTCSVCMSVSIQDTHRCIERSTDCDCPICGEYMFTSPQTVVFMRCGHSIHHRCYYEHMKSSYRCPICSKSIVNMEWQFRHLERAIETQPMPPEFQDTRAWVYCNDCNAKTSVKYHWLGLKCAVCDSYNTAQLQILSGPNLAPVQEAADAPASVERSAEISRSNSRGRTRETISLSQRPTTSAPPPTAIQGLLERSSWPNIQARNAHSAAPNAVPISLLYPLDNQSDVEDSLDGDEDGSQMEFWGGESPRVRHASPRPEHGIEMDLDSSSEEDDDDSEDEDMSDDAEDDETDDYNGMEIFGHR